VDDDLVVEGAKEYAVLDGRLPAGASANVAGNSKNTALRRERELAVLRRRVDFDWRV
jgi:hypothetical protein